MDQPRSDSTRPFAESLLAAIESILALGVAMGLTLVLTLPLLRFTAEFPLVWPESPTEPAFEELIGLVDDRGLDGSVEIVRDDDPGGPRMVVSGLSLLELATSGIPALVARAGFETARPTYRPGPVEEVLRDSGRLVFSIQALVFVVVGGVLIRFRVTPAARATAVDHGRAVLIGLLGGVAAFGISVVIGIVLNLLGLPVEEQEWAVELFRDRARLMQLLPWIVLIVPFSEEVFFRGYVLRFLNERAGLSTAVVVSTALFALVHFNPTGIVVYLGIGAVLAYAYLRSGSIVTPVLAHAVHNSLTLAASLLFGPPGPSAG